MLHVSAGSAGGQAECHSERLIDAEGLPRDSEQDLMMQELRHQRPIGDSDNWTPPYTTRGGGPQWSSERGEAREKVKSTDTPVRYRPGTPISSACGTTTTPVPPSSVGPGQTSRRIQSDSGQSCTAECAVARPPGLQAFARRCARISRAPITAGTWRWCTPDASWAACPSTYFANPRWWVRVNNLRMISAAQVGDENGSLVEYSRNRSSRRS